MALPVALSVAALAACKTPSWCCTTQLQLAPPPSPGCPADLCLRPCCSLQGIAMALSQLPLTLLDVVVFGTICYFMMGWYRAPGYFFVYTLVLCSSSLSVSSLFR